MKISKEEADRLTIKETKEAEVVSIEALDPSKIYHVTVRAGESNARALQGVIEAFKNAGLRAMFSQENVQVEELSEMFAKLPEEKKAIIRAALEQKNESSISQS